MTVRLLPISLLLTACGPSTADQATLAKVEAAQQRGADSDDRISCARAGEAALRRVCVVERTDTADGLVLTVRHPDGAFRRLLVTDDGRGVIAADGAEPASFALLGEDQIEVTLAGERYRLPATVKPR
ncbi:MAG: hypothetical protein V4659_09275 [Pseudomonadota bacterium]